MATPLPRRTLVGTSLTYSMLAAPLLGLCAILGAWIGSMICSVSGSVPWLRFFSVAAESTVLCFLFGALATYISVLAPDRGKATLRLGVTIFAFLIADTTARLWSGGHWIAYLTPYGYFRPSTIVSREDGSWIAMRQSLFLLLGAGALVFAALRAEGRRRSV